MQGKAKLILYNTHLEAKFYRNACLPFADPLSMALEQRENLLMVRNILMVKYTTDYKMAVVVCISYPSFQYFDTPVIRRPYFQDFLSYFCLADELLAVDDTVCMGSFNAGLSGLPKCIVGQG